MQQQSTPRLATGGLLSLAVGLGSLALLGLPATSRAQAVAQFSLQPVADTSIYADPAGGDLSWDHISDGQGESLWLGVTAGGIVRRALLRFDLSVVPAGHRVLSASLSLYESRARDDHVVSVHRLLAPWGEGASNGGAAGVGNTARPGDATWRWRDLGVAEWQQRGGDFASQASASTLVGPANNRYTWDSTPGLVADVQGWLDQPASSHGWILIGHEAASQNAKRFDSLQSGVLSQRPLLLLQTSPVPEPATLALLTAGGVVLAWRRRVGPAGRGG